MTTDTPLGLYIHLPFCKQKCPYCDFYSLPPSPAILFSYCKALQRELLQYRSNPPLKADTIYFGGGTPTLLPPKLLSSILQTAREVFSLVQPEITIESNPETLSPSLLFQLKEAGFNRLSIGMQSGVPQELKALSRPHTVSDVQNSVRWAAQAGFENLSLDLMLGIPYQTEKSFAETLAIISALAPQHLSAYLLKIEPNTPFWNHPVVQHCGTPDQTATLYEQAVESFQKMGWLQYEISNFAKPGFSAVHNLKYWQRKPYLGFGPSAHSFYQGKRRCHPKDLSSYLVSPSQLILEEDVNRAEEYLLLGLRLKEGIYLHRLEKMGQDTQFLQQRARLLAKQKLLYLKDAQLRLTPKGMLVSNSILLFLRETLQL